jgi:2-haloalkanoic acid dehalogenase type II
MSAIRGVLFDLGGTLIHFDGPWNEVMAAANQELVNHLQEQGLNLDKTRFLNEFEERLEEYYEQREAEFIEYTTANVLRDLLKDFGFSNVSSELLGPALKRLYAVSQSHWKREDDTIDTLDSLRDRGYQLALISNASDDVDVQTLVDNAEIRLFFDTVMSSAKAGIRKPNPLIFHMVLDQIDIRPEEAVMVGDTLGADILGARNAGIFSIWITRRADTPANRDHADTIKPDAEISRLAQLPSLLQKLNSEVIGSEVEK